MISFSTSVNLPASPQEICDQIFDVSNWNSFEGYGPIPGIKETNMVNPDGQRLGTRFEVLNRDGSRHVETVVEYTPGAKLALRMDSFTPPLNKLADCFVETWGFAEDGGTTNVVRSFELYSRNIVGSVVLWMISWILKKAVQRHLASMRASLDSGDLLAPEARHRPQGDCDRISAGPQDPGP